MGIVRTYLMVYDNNLGTREEVRSILNSMPEVNIWRFDIPNCFYIVSYESQVHLATIIREKAGRKGNLIVAEIEYERCWGWLTQETWYILKNKKLSDEMEAALKQKLLSEK